MLHYVFRRLPNNELRVLRTPQGDAMGFANRDLAFNRATFESQKNSDIWFVDTNLSLDGTRAKSLLTA